MKIGIGVDNYKIKKFEAALQDAGFADVKVFPFVHNTSLITVDKVPKERVHDIHLICTKLQIDFKHSN